MSTIAYTVGQVYEVDPATLTIGSNVRIDTHPAAKDFAASIKARGVLEAITAWVGHDGSLVVQRGQRRTLTAATVGTPSGTVPVRVVVQPEEVDRITDQVTENYHRAAMHASEVRDAVEQLALLGVSAAQITKRTAIKRETVNAALVVSGSRSGRDLMDAKGLTLAQAAAFAEFEDDPAAVGRLERGLSWGHNLDHTLQRLRDERAEQAALALEVQRLRTEGLPMLDPDQVPESLNRVRLANLVTADGQPVPEEQYAAVTGAAVALTTEWEYPDENDGDDNRQDSHNDSDEGPDQLAQERLVYVSVWVCLDPGAAGLRYRYDATPAGANTTPPGQDAEADQARAEAEQEAQSQQRRTVRENNAAWRSAEKVRRTWLAQFASRKTPPTGAEALVCQAVLTAPYSLTKAMERHHKLLCSTLETEPVVGLYGNRDACARLAAAPSTPKGHTMRTLAAVIIGWEESTDVHTWRNPTDWDRQVMSALIDWGYDAGTVERLLVATSNENAAPDPDPDADLDRDPEASSDVGDEDENTPKSGQANDQATAA
ncbi:MAG: ParB/Srx family N-terminal domain-containing protein [Nostocoides sp.]